MKLIVGLGNPGDKYARNRHNIGFMTLERIADEFGRSGWRKKFSALVCDVELDGDKALLMCPQTFYNEAGRSVSEAARFHKIEAEDIIVFHDEIDLAPGKVRVKTGGGLAGNNGLRSIASHMGPDFVRVRIGVGHPGNKDAVKHYVLNDFPKADLDGLDVLMKAMAMAAPKLTEGAHDKFQTSVAQALNDFRDDDDNGDEKKERKPAADKSPAKPAKKSSGRHASGEGGNKRQSALADNLKRWLGARENKDN
ncbi:MAG: PTH1 family peptidyl-tRNA hydrolase [Hyphomicrobiaceae bacterium]|jgi:PTH1 family peptidyl-tRNA hydrolase